MTPISETNKGWIRSHLSAHKNLNEPIGDPHEYAELLLGLMGRFAKDITIAELVAFIEHPDAEESASHTKVYTRQPGNFWRRKSTKGPSSSGDQ